MFATDRVLWHARPMLCLLATALCTTALSAAEVETLRIGAAAPPFSLPGVDGKTYTLDDFAAADVLVIVFTCNHCPTAQAYEDRIIALDRDYRDKGVTLVAISPNDDAAVRLDELGYTDLGDSLEDMQLRAKHRNFRFPYLYDGATQEVSRAYGPVATPHVFVFDKQRKLRFTGRIDDSDKPEKVKSHDTRNAIEALLAGRSVPVAKTKTFGCSVKWTDKRDAAKESLAKWNKEEAMLEVVDAGQIKDLIKNDSGKLRLINVWATFCGPCIAEMPAFVEMHRMYRRRDFELVLISADSPESTDAALKVLQEHHASCRNVLFNSDDKYELIELVDPKWDGALPYTMIVNAAGKVVYRHAGEMDPLTVKRAVVEQLGRVYK